MAKTGASRSGLANVVEDTTPQLGGDLDVNGKKFTGAVSVAENMSYNSSGQNFSTASKTLVDCTATNTLSYANTTVRVFANTGTYNATATQLIGQFYVVDTTGSIIKNDPALTGYLPITYLFNSGGTYKGDTNATSALVIRDFVGNSTFNTVNGGTLAVGEYTAFLSQGKVETGATITTYRAFWATNLPTVTGTITNQIGIDIDAITKATTLAVGLRIGQPTTATTNRALQLTGTGTTVDGGIQFGNTADTTNLYRSASGTLKTGGNLVIGTAGTAAGSAATIDGTQTLTNKTINGSQLVAASVADSKLIYGKIRSRQGGSATVWGTAGTTSYDVSATNTFMQAGSRAITTDNFVITFPTAYTYAPVVTAVVASAISANAWVEVTAQDATTFTVRVINNAGVVTSERINWIAIGE